MVAQLDAGLRDALWMVRWACALPGEGRDVATVGMRQPIERAATPSRDAGRTPHSHADRD